MKKICRDCFEISAGNKVRCAKCGSTNLGIHYSASERRKDSGIGSDWRSHLYVTGEERKAQLRRSQASRTDSARPFNEVDSIPSNPSSPSPQLQFQRKALGRTGNRHSTTPNRRSKSAFLRSFMRQPVSWTVLVLSPIFVGYAVFIPGGQAEMAILKEARQFLGISQETPLETDAKAAQASSSQESRESVLSALWSSRDRAMADGFVVTSEYEFVRNQEIYPGASGEIGAHLSNDSLGWLSGTGEDSFIQLAEVLTDAQLMYSTSGNRTTFTHTKFGCTGWVELLDNLITGHFTDCPPFSGSATKSISYGLTEEEQQLLVKAQGLSND